MKLRQLRAALAVQTSGQIARAAEQLNISQPALSRAIQALELELGVMLFLRGRSGSHTTLAGESFLARVARALEHLRAAEQEIMPKSRLRQSGISTHYLSRHASDHEIRVVIEVDNIRSITAAARNLNISQPAANRSLRKLEKSLGLTLFTRSS